MDDAFREPTPAEIQRAVLQFIGENIGELKTLDSHIINKTNTLNGMMLQPEAVLRSIPQPTQQQAPQRPLQQAPQEVSQQAPPVVITQVQDPQPIQLPVTDPNQLEFDFNPGYYEEIMKVLNSHTRELRDLHKSVRELTDIVSQHNKKKD
jgi:hypothetical protein